jgi:hypothetical protein
VKLRRERVSLGLFQEKRRLPLRSRVFCSLLKTSSSGKSPGPCRSRWVPRAYLLDRPTNASAGPPGHLTVGTCNAREASTLLGSPAGSIWAAKWFLKQGGTARYAFVPHDPASPATAAEAADLGARDAAAVSEDACEGASPDGSSASAGPLSGATRLAPPLSIHRRDIRRCPRYRQLAWGALG